MLAAIKRAVYIQTVVSRIIDTVRAINNIFLHKLHIVHMSINREIIRHVTQIYIKFVCSKSCLLICI